MLAEPPSALATVPPAYFTQLLCLRKLWQSKAPVTMSTAGVLQTQVSRSCGIVFPHAPCWACALRSSLGSSPLQPQGAYYPPLGWQNCGFALLWCFIPSLSYSLFASDHHPPYNCPQPHLRGNGRTCLCDSNKETNWCVAAAGMRGSHVAPEDVRKASRCLCWLTKG